MGNLLVKSWCKLGNADVAYILRLLSHALTGVVFCLLGYDAIFPASTNRLLTNTPYAAKLVGGHPGQNQTG